MNEDLAKRLNKDCDIVIVASRYLQKAKRNTFVCPNCSSGTGKNGTGMYVDEKRNKLHCFACGVDWSVIDVILHCENLSTSSSDFVTALKIGCQIYGLHFEENKFVHTNAKDDFDNLDEKGKSKKTFALIHADIVDAQKHIEDLPLEDRRGLTIDTLKHFGVGYSANWTHPNNRLADEFAVPTRRIIIPTGDCLYHYNAILPKRDRNGSNKKYRAMNAGTKEIFNSAAIVPNKIVVIVEGEIDAMSIFQATRGNVNVIALGGAGQSNLKNFLQANIPTNERINYSFVVLFDNDSTGKEQSDKLIENLLKIGCPAVSKFLDNGDVKVDANDILINEGDAALNSRVEQIISAAQIEFDDVKENLLNYTENEISDELPDGLTDAQTIEWIKSNLDWEKRKGGKMRVSSTQRNLDLIFDYDPNIKNLIGYDEFYKQEVFLKEPSWKKNCIGDEWKNADDSHLRGYLKQTYTDYRDTESVMDNIIIYSRKNSFHPVKNYLESLHWDGVPRAETYFSKFLNADDTPYTREITLKWLLGAIARIYHEGCDFQFALVLHGKQGIGKGYCLRMLGQKWYVSLTDSLDDSHALDTIERGWIIEIAELAAGRKAEINAQKAFLSDCADTRRKAYARRAETTPRHCVFAITVNDEHFLRDLTGNRRYKILESHSAQNEIVEGLTAEYVNQVWAEAFHMYQTLFKDGFNDQLLRLSREVDVKADEIAEKHLQDDGLQGEIAAFLDKPILPSCIWERLTKEERRKFFADGKIKLDDKDIITRIKTQIRQTSKRDSTLKEFSDYMSDSKNGVNGYVLKEGYGEDVYYFYGSVDREETCAAEIFNECFGNDKRKSTLRINEVLANLEGWKREDKRSKNFSTVYGQQRFYYDRNTENLHHASTFAKRIDALFADGN